MSTQQLNYVTKELILVALLLTPLFAQAACESVWSGTVERLRYYDQSGAEKVMVYIFPGSNANYVGFTSSKMLLDGISKAKESQVSVTGYTGADCRIQWMDLVQN
ncbi:MAG: hypothetical protein K9K84_11880 [Methylovulum sp.]|nr:hypothetical protein [Methylovulum sp.]